MEVTSDYIEAGVIIGALFSALCLIALLIGSLSPSKPVTDEELYGKEGPDEWQRKQMNFSKEQYADWIEKHGALDEARIYRVEHGIQELEEPDFSKGRAIKVLKICDGISTSWELKGFVMLEDNWLSENDILTDEEGAVIPILKFKETEEFLLSSHPVTPPLEGHSNWSWKKVSCVLIDKEVKPGDIFYANPRRSLVLN